MKFVRGYKGVDGSTQSRVGFPKLGKFSGYEDTVIDGFHDPGEVSVSEEAPPEYRGDPIHLTAVTSVVSGGQGIPNIDAIRNTLKVPIEVHAIKILCTSASDGVFCSGTIAMRLSMKLSKDDDSIGLTQGFIPIGLFSGASFAENPVLAEAGMSPSFPGGDGFSNFTIKLKRPIILPPGAYLEPVFQHLGQISSNISCRISLAGRTCPTSAWSGGAIHLPYYAHYEATPKLGNALVSTSTEQDLVNPFDGPLHVERLVGRIVIFGAVAGTASENVENFGLSGTGAVQGHETDGTELIQVTMWASNGYPIIAPATPFRMAFDYFTREWVTEFDLDSGGYLIAQIDMVTRDVQSGAGVDNIPLQVGIGLCGSREVSL